MPFECSQCGECCTVLGLVHTIHEVCGPLSFIVNNRYTGEKTRVVIDPDKVSLFSDQGIFSSHPDACPFFRFEPVSGTGFCTVHLTRPEICRDYGCWRILILDSRGRRAGRIMAQRHLASEDPVVTRLFLDQIDRLVEPDDAAWDDRVVRMLREAGYTVRV